MKVLANRAILTPSETPANRAVLRWLELAERAGLAGLAAPAVAIVGLLLVIPFAWLLLQSLRDVDGALSLANYRALTDPLYRRAIATTLEVSTIVAVGSILIGYPVAYLLAQLPRRIAGLLTIGVLLPYWTSTLVRTYAWMVLLQRNGVVNDWLVSHDFVAVPLALVNNLTGVVIGMLHVMTPVLIIPLYGAMKSVDPDLMRAAAACGATPAAAFRHVYLPRTLPGLAAGAVLVFVVSLGYYVTPALLGGGNVNVIAMQMQTTLATEGDWGMVSALGVVLIALAFVASTLLRAAVRAVTRMEDR
ncbi:MULTISPECIES: ABC transporter permease [unclassified Burkholderia]|uniref:ABC transporter permease n=1 Tax=unclassified Burkholderia TaxID=2613784 RepID=UPI000F58B579|nr:MULTISPECIES: ABC transporter permease [unclassified Burkholderia]RQS26461.1 ABC transporter permease [Burkholderia sp. Bp8995]RQS48439.1 ABC transporter permease [Burkholderia sp. Bp8989]